MAQNGTMQPSLPLFTENGRYYDQSGRYLFPIDETEKDRLDIFHKLIYIARKEKHWEYLLPERARILDIGTGTGIWAIDVSDRLWKNESNHGSVLGLDLALIQPENVPSTVAFVQADIEQPWPASLAEFDLVHFQMLLGSIRDWKEMYRKAWRHLKPNGFVEHVEIEWRFYSDDGTLPRDSPLHRWSSTLHDAMDRAGMPLGVDGRTRANLEDIGFIDVGEKTIKLPINPWNPDDEHEALLGRWFNLGLSQAFKALTLAPLTRIGGWSPDHVDAFSKDFEKAICNLNYHAYCRLHIWTARKPSS